MEWTLPNGEKIKLMSIPQLKACKDGELIISIMGEVRTYLEDGKYADDDTRGGMTAWAKYEKELKPF